MRKRILSVVCALCILLQMTPVSVFAGAGVEVLTAQEIQEARTLLAADKDAPTWQEGMALNNGMNALQIQQYLEWLMSDKVDGSMICFQDTIHLLKLAGANSSSIKTIEEAFQTWQNELAYYADELKQERTALEADLSKLEASGNLSEFQQQKLAIEVRDRVTNVKNIRDTVSGSYLQYETELKNYEKKLSDQLAVIDPDGNSVEQAETQLEREAKKLLGEEPDAAAVVSGMQFGFLVKNASGKPESDAAVTVSCSDRQDIVQTKKTGTDGLVTFLVKDFCPNGDDEVTVDVTTTLKDSSVSKVQSVVIRGGAVEVLAGADTEKGEGASAGGAQKNTVDDSRIASVRNTVVSAENRQEVISGMDIAPGTVQYATLTDQTSGEQVPFAFWLTATDSGDRKAKLVWCNLDDPDSKGEVYDSRLADNWRETQATDYDFAVMGRQNKVGIGILSGVFGNGADQKPIESRMDVAVMQLAKGQDGKWGLSISATDEYQADVMHAENGYALSMLRIYFMVTTTTNYYLNAMCNREDIAGGVTDKICSVDMSKTAGSAATLDQLTEDEPVPDNTATRFLVSTTPIGQTFSGVTVPVGQSLSCYYWVTEDNRLYLRLNGNQLKLSDGVAAIEKFVQESTNDSREFMFFLKRVQTENGKDSYRLMGESRTGTDSTIRDYDVSLQEPYQFRSVTVNDGSAYGRSYLYWTEPVTDSNAYQIRCVRFDRQSNTMSAPFTLAQLPEKPENLTLLSDGSGYYTTDLLENGVVCRKMVRFEFGLRAAISLADVVSVDPRVSAGEYTDCLLAVKNTGNLPISHFTAELQQGGTTFRTVEIDCCDPETTDPQYSVTRVDGSYDGNCDRWLIVTGQYASAVGESMTTKLLMPEGVHVYKLRFRMPEDWDGSAKLTVKLGNLYVVPQYSSFMGAGSSAGSTASIVGFDSQGQMLPGVSTSTISVERAAVSQTEMEKTLDIGMGDLKLTSRLYQDLTGAQFVQLNVTGRSKINGTAAPTLTASINGKTVWTYSFAHVIDESYGYTLNIPVEQLLKGYNGGDIYFTLTGNETGQEYDTSDNVSTVKTEAGITILDDGNGTAALNPAGAVVGSKVTLSASPKEGYHFKEWKVVSGGVTMNGNEFIMPAAKVVIKAVFEAHTGGSATCTKKAQCEVCEKEYGSLKAHDYSVKAMTLETLKSAGTCAKKAVYYYSCSGCGAVEKNDAHTFMGKENPVNHTNLKHVKAVKATVSHAGNKEYWYCKDCNTYFADKKAVKKIRKADTVIPKLTKKDDPKKPETKENTEQTKEEAVVTQTVAPTVTSSGKKTVTGDENGVAGWILLFVASGAVVTVGCCRKRRKL